jgi:hypothetical protein
MGDRRRQKFTDKNVLTLKPIRGKQYLVWDTVTRGLAILVNPAGSKSYRCVCQYPGDPKRFYKNIGRVGVVTLQEARDQTILAQQLARQGLDPRADDPRKSDAFSVVVERYTKTEQIGRRNNKSALATQKVILRGCAEWERRAVATIRSTNVEDLLCRIRDGDGEKKPRRYLANRLHIHLKDFFDWCVRKKVITASPMVGVDAPWSGSKPRYRDWFKGAAADDAIKRIWHAADEIGGVEGRYVKTIMLLAKRKTALLNMRWEQIDQTWFWDAPESDVAIKRLHGVPLPGLAQRVLHPRQKQGKVFEGISLALLQKKVRERVGFDFFWHGARHIAETKMAELRDKDDRSLILPHVRDLLLDHSPNRGAGKGYDHHDYIPEMRKAMEIWAAYIERLVQAEGVAVLR